MKRVEILKKLAKAGFEFKEGANHTKIYKDGVYISAIGRHTEIELRNTRKIEAQTGVMLTK